ncbi:serine/threonine-protein kinase [Rhodococcus sp. CH91]|uniref:serine/threonine-protein kinase n=1 Tax=Rhodococcus sp. CH91 TaxID=2910256 RepID=UPI001F4B854F|nr:serine/threonine-protein kinase [Rhodococcus sp. CH91]
MTVHKVLGSRYELSGLLGVGGTGEIYDAWDTRLQRPVAVKLLRPEAGGKPDVRRRFEVEARAAAALSHRCIVAVYDTGEHDGRPYLVMERLRGRTLADDIARGPLPAGRVHTVLADILGALVVAHAAGILHRDIKPANVLIEENGDVKVADFGIAKSVGDDLTRTGELVGTVAYLSPDRITGHPASVVDDLYAVGIVGYEALCGRRPFAGDNILALAREITHGEPQPLADVRPDAPPGLVAVIERALSRDPSDRFGSAHEMLAMLQGPGDHRGAVTTRLRASDAVDAEPLATNSPVHEGRPRGVRLAVGLTLIGAMAVGGIAVGFGRDTGTPLEATPGTRIPGTSASAPQRVPITPDPSAPTASVGVPVSTVIETPEVPPVVPGPANTPATPPTNTGPGLSDNGSRPGNRNGNSEGNNGNNGNGNGNAGNRGNNGNGNNGNGNGG